MFLDWIFGVRKYSQDVLDFLQMDWVLFCRCLFNHVELGKKNIEIFGTVVMLLNVNNCSKIMKQCTSCRTLYAPTHIKKKAHFDINKKDSWLSWFELKIILNIPQISTTGHLCLCYRQLSFNSILIWHRIIWSKGGEDIVPYVLHIKIGLFYCLAWTLLVWVYGLWVLVASYPSLFFGDKFL